MDERTLAFRTLVLPSEKAFTSILTITNPDKQSATFRFDVA